MSGELFVAIFSRQQFIQLITAYMTEILTLHVVEDKLTNILAAVADTFD
ncbi:Trichohyalin [Klebsiella pneumoniae IS22]|nr:Trichohyalin [Klebsiella pneumoniae IS22]